VDKVEPYLPNLWDGFLVTVQVTLVSLGLALAIAFVLGLGRLSHRRPLRVSAGAVIEFFRGTSVVVQLFWVFYALPLLPLELRLSAPVAGVAVLSLNAGAYAAEVVRGAVQALPRGQHEAAIALNLSGWTRMRRVILPQALPAMLPPFGTTAVDLAKASALIGFITVEDLTFWAEQTRLVTGEAAVVYGLTLVAYFGFALALSALFNCLALLTPLRRAERRAGRGARSPRWRIFSRPLPELTGPGESR
jgi:polar amino acid transport system permease protein